MKALYLPHKIIIYCFVAIFTLFLTNLDAQISYEQRVGSYDSRVADMIPLDDEHYVVLRNQGTCLVNGELSLIDSRTRETVWNTPVSQDGQHNMIDLDKAGSFIAFLGHRSESFDLPEDSKYFIGLINEDGSILIEKSMELEWSDNSGMDFIADGTGYFFAADRLFSLDDDLEIEWSKSFDKEIIEIKSDDNGNVAVLSDSLYILSDTGELLRTHESSAYEMIYYNGQFILRESRKVVVLDGIAPFSVINTYENIPRGYTGLTASENGYFEINSANRIFQYNDRFELIDQIDFPFDYKIKSINSTASHIWLNTSTDYSALVSRLNVLEDISLRPDIEIISLDYPEIKGEFIETDPLFYEQFTLWSNVLVKNAGSIPITHFFLHDEIQKGDGCFVIRDIKKVELDEPLLMSDTIRIDVETIIREYDLPFWPPVMSYRFSAFAPNDMIDQNSRNNSSNHFGFILTTSFDGQEKSESTVFPNPASEVLNVQSESRVLKAEIIDMTGSSLFIESIKDDMIDLSGLSPGKYVLRLYTIDNIEIHRFIKL